MYQKISCTKNLYFTDCFRCSYRFLGCCWNHTIQLFMSSVVYTKYYTKKERIYISKVSFSWILHWPSDFHSICICQFLIAWDFSDGLCVNLPLLMNVWKPFMISLVFYVPKCHRVAQDMKHIDKLPSCVACRLNVDLLRGIKQLIMHFIGKGLSPRETLGDSVI